MGNNRGFTLLEIIIAMTILAILMTAFAPQIVKSKTDENIIAKAQMEVEARQNAARWFYNDYGFWPTNAGLLKAPVANVNNPAATPYLNPSSTEQSPFWSTYSFSVSSNTFAVNVIAPSDIAQRFGSRLVSPVYTAAGTGRTAVSSTVPKPGNELIANNFQDIKYMSIDNPGTIVTKPTCPTGKTAYIYVTPADFRGGTSGYAIIGATAKAVDNGNGTWTVQGEVKDINNTWFTDGTSIKLSVVALCR